MCVHVLIVLREAGVLILLVLCGLVVIILTSISLYNEYVKDNTIDVFNPIYPITGFWIMMFIVRPTYVIYNGSNINPLAIPLPELNNFPIAIIYGTCGWLAMYIGFNRGSPISVRFPNIQARTEAQLSSYALSVLVFGAIGIAGLGATILQLYSGYSLTEILFNTINILHETQGTGRYVFSYLRGYIFFAFFISVAANLKYSNQYPTFLTIGLFICSLFAALISGFRWNFIVVIIGPIILAHYISDGFRVKLHHVILALPIFLLTVPFLGIFRTGNFLIPTPLMFVDSLRQFDDFVVLITMLDRGHLQFQLGKQYLWRFSGIALIPRAIWEGKPIISPAYEYTINVYGPGSTHTPTAIGELYYQFHIAGIVLGMYLYGCFWRYAYYLARYYNSAIIFAFYAYLLLMAIKTFRSSIGGFLLKHFLLGAVILLPLLLENLRVHKYRNDIDHEWIG